MPGWDGIGDVMICHEMPDDACRYVLSVDAWVCMGGSSGSSGVTVKIREAK